MTERLKILLYGDVDLNLIDGSAMWLVSLTQVLHEDRNIDIDILQKRPIINNKLVKPLLKKERVNFIDPFSCAKGDEGWYKRKRLLVDDAIQKIKEQEKQHNYDVILVRGFELAYKLSKIPFLSKKIYSYITDFQHDKDKIDEKQLESLKSIYHNSRYCICQTHEMKEYLKEVLDVSGEKFFILNPMIPNMDSNKPNFVIREKSLIYTGKFAKDWNSDEILEAFAKIVQTNHNFKLIVAGDKFNLHPENPKFKEEVTQKLKTYKNVNWVGGVTREEVQKLIQQSDIGIGWRNNSLNDSLELSTKALEYGALGKPIILNRTPMHERLFGSEYPFYANSEEEFISCITQSLTNNDIYVRAAEMVYKVCTDFTFAKTYERISPFLWESKNKRIRIVFAGHDLKFAKMFIDRFASRTRYEVEIDQWKGHSVNDESHSTNCLNWADVIFCEWGLGNAVWYSHRVRKDQTLIVRMHLQERETKHYLKFNYYAIDSIIAISPYIRDEFVNNCGIPSDNMVMIYNAVNCKKFDLEKYEDTQFNLGITGICPSRKRLDRAIDIFEKLKEKDSRYTLHIKGQLPTHYPWLWKKEEEKKYYEQVFKRINSSKWRDSIIFDGFGNDMDTWFQKIGYILSTSDFESFHLAPAEGMASGAFPIIIRWEGCHTIYDEDFIFENVDEAATFILKRNQAMRPNDIDVRAYVRKRFDIEKIFGDWEELIARLR
nr:glycosyltransferase family 4 protein [Bacillus sp. ABP14]